MRKPIRSTRFAAMLLLGVASSACGSDPYSLPAFDPSLGVDVSQLTKTPSGLYYQDLEIGTGLLASEADSVLTAYVGRFSDGTTFSTASFWLHIGKGDAIPGYDEGVSTMRVGGRRKLVIPPDLGYGKESFGPIPANSTLIFDVDLTDAVPFTSSGG